MKNKDFPLLSHLPEWTDLDQLSLSQKLVLVVGSSLAYLVIFLILRPWIGEGAMALSFVPVFLAGWSFGILGGVGWSLGVSVINFLVLNQIFRYSIEQILPGGGLPGALFLIAISPLGGWLKNLSRRFRSEMEARQKAARALRESENKYSLLFENTAEGIAIEQLVFDEQGRPVDWIILDANPSFERIIGISIQAAIGKMASQVFGSRQAIEPFLEIYMEALLTGASTRFEACTPAGDRVVTYSVTPLDHDQLAVIFNDITEQKQAEAAESEQRRLTTALAEITSALNRTLLLDEVLDCILANIGRVTSFDVVNIMLVEGDQAFFARHYGYHNFGLIEYAKNWRRKYSELYCLTQMAETGIPVAIQDTRTWEQWTIIPETEWIRSYAGLPIRARGKIVGFLNLMSAKPGFYQAEQIELLQPFANQAALAIENARAFEETQRRAQRLALINRVSATFNQPIELRAVLQAAVDGLAEALELEQVGLALFDETHRLRLAADCPGAGNRSMVGVEIPLKNNLSMDHILNTKTALYIKDAPNDPLLQAVRPFMLGQHIASILIVPLIVRDEVIGTVGCDIINRPRQFSSEEIELAETLTNLAAVRIGQARLFDEERKRAAELALLHATSLDITMPHNLPNLLQTIVERAVWLLDSQGGTLYLSDTESQELRCMVSYKNEYDRLGTILKYGEGAAGIVAKMNRPLIVADFSTWENKPAIYDNLLMPFTVLSAPVTWQNQVTGVIQVIREVNQKPYSQSDEDLIGLFSNQVAIALENARLYNEVQQLAITDTTTGLYNRRGLQEMGLHEVERSHRFHRPLCALMLDIDYFKRVNDTYGHPVGDQVLVELARLCRESLRNIDILCRYGGEEFVILLTESDLESALQVAGWLCSTIAHTPMQTQAGKLFISVSIGIGELCGLQDSLSALIHRADEALYAAKRAGRNRVEIYQEEAPGLFETPMV